MKTQHAYSRTLDWIERNDDEASTALARVLNQPAEKSVTSLVELSIEHNLPFKIHTGYHPGNDRMPVRRIPAGNMCALLAHNLDARFVLIHIAYPYNDELGALA